MSKIVFKTLIIDDEEPARLYLKELLEVHSPIIQIIGEAKDGFEAINLINNLKPDLIFLDIQMPGKNGFEVLKSISHIPLVIFCTAYDEYALDAFETNSVDYLVKPISLERVNKSVKKLLTLNKVVEERKVIDLLQSLLIPKPVKTLTSLPVRIGDRIIFIKISDISFFKAKDKYVEIHTIMNKSYIIDESLSSLQLKLSSNFIRIQRSLIINTEKILEIKKYSLGRYRFLMNDLSNTALISGKNYSIEINNLTKI